MLLLLCHKQERDVSRPFVYLHPGYSTNGEVAALLPKDRLEPRQSSTKNKELSTKPPFMQLLYHSFHTAEIPPNLLQRIIIKTALSIINIEYWWKILLPVAVLRKISLAATLFTSNVAITLAIVSKTTIQYVEDGPGFSIARFTYVFTGMCIFIQFTLLTNLGISVYRVKVRSHADDFKLKCNEYFPCMLHEK